MPKYDPRRHRPPKAIARRTDDESGWHLRLYGVVGDEWDGFTDNTVADLLDGLDVGGGDARINSPGGYIYQGMAIYNLLKEKRPRVVRVDGLAASMGSVIMLAGQRTEIAQGAMVMIHNPWNIAMGDADDLRKTAEILDKFKQSILDIYADKTGQKRELLSDMMDEETWLTAEEAVEWGFADAIVEEEADLDAVNLTVLSETRNMPAHLTCLMQAQLDRKPKTEDAAAAVNHQPAGETAMTENVNMPAAGPDTAKDEEALNRARNEAVKAERDRVKAIRNMVSTAELDAPFADQLIEDGVSEPEAQAAVDRLAAYLAKAKEATKPSNRIAIEITRDERDTVRAGAAKALLNRWDPRGFKIDGDDPARQYAGMSLREMAREMAEARGVNTRGMTVTQVAKAALHSTSDFPLILENVISKSLRSRYELASRTFVALGRQSTLPDYKEVSRAQLGEAPKLQKVQEGGEYTYGTVGEGAEKYRLFKYGKILAITSEAIINDDMDAFTRIPGDMGAAAGQLESELFWAHFTGNPTMYDSTALFHADHGNLAGTAAVISVSAIGAGRASMRKQKGLGGQHFINATPRYLVVPPDIETVADQFVSQNLQADAAGNINPFAGRLQVISEPALSANSATAWYLWADPATIDTLEYAYLQGEEGPQIETEEGFDVDGLKVKVRHNFGVKALDWRGLYKNAGA